MNRKLTVSLFAAFLSILTYSQTYYIDYEAGSDSNDGLSQLTAWKHCPGDANAANIPNNIIINPGSTILFKGGVVYRGSIKMKFSGNVTSPITYKGDGWGAEKAIIDGSEPMTGWRQCASEAEGGKNWQNCYINYAPAGLSAFNTRLAENNEFLWLSQEPDQPDPFFFDATANFASIPQSQQDTTFLIDASVFNQADASYWDGSYLLLWVLPNVVPMRAIKEYIPAENKVIFDKTNDPSGYNKYSIYNSIHAIDQPGEYYFDERPETDGTHKVVLYPRNPSNIINNKITCFTKQFGIDINDESYLTIEGFEVRHFAGSELTHGVGIGTVTAAYKENTEIIIRNNKIYRNVHATGGYGGIYLSNCKNSIIENNEIFECMMMRGIFCPGDSNLIVSGNSLRKVGGTGMTLYTAKDCRVFNNTISDGHGTHDNGMTFYLGCERILVYNNIVTNYNNTLTFQASKDLVFVNNIFDGANNVSYVVACWSGMTGPATFINNTIIGSTNNTALYLSPNAPYANNPAGDSITYRMINNILEGGGWNTTNSHQYLRFNNLYTGLAWFQTSPGWSPAEGEIVDMDGTKYTALQAEDIFVNPTGENYSLKIDSRAINAGIDPSPYFPFEYFPDFNLSLDRNGNSRPYDDKWDIGAYEYDGSTSIKTDKNVTDRFSYSQNYPNPFSTSTTICFNVTETGHYSLKIFDISGREIAILLDGTIPTGHQQIIWNGTNSAGHQVGSGVYFYQLKTNNGFMGIKKVMLIR
ncbi:MAG: right-handed parallel beta-helix repeat-containing protein [Bacteroidales bacterium]